MTTAVAYLRTSSATNVGQDKDSAKRQQIAIEEYAASLGITIVKTYYDAAVSGADPVAQRPGFAEMVEYMAGNGARTIIVENASRFARDLIVQEVGHTWLKAQGFSLIAADDPDAFTADTPTAVLIRQVLGATAQFEKSNLVAKLRGARERKKALTGRCEGRKGHVDLNPAAVAAAKALAAQGLSLRRIAIELEAQGFLNERGQRFHPESVKSLIA